MSTLQSLRNATLLARLVLVWLVLVTGVAIAAPLAQPKTFALVCSGAGVMQLLVNPGDGGEAPASATLDCPLCASVAAPPPVARSCAQPAPAQALAQPGVVTPLRATPGAAPPPARAPPTVS
jgi:hypothetical protein